MKKLTKKQKDFDEMANHIIWRYVIPFIWVYVLLKVVWWLLINYV